MKNYDLIKLTFYSLFSYFICFNIDCGEIYPTASKIVSVSAWIRQLSMERLDYKVTKIDFVKETLKQRPSDKPVTLEKKMLRSFRIVSPLGN